MKTAALPEELATRADEIRATVAQNLDDLLKSQRWSRRATAAQLGLTHTYVNSRAAGDTDLSASDLAMFADFLDVPVSRFFEVPDAKLTDLDAQRSKKKRPVNGLKQLHTGLITDMFTREQILVQEAS
jgi:transcriptional regulator with XRE-family HTH domain